MCLGHAILKMHMAINSLICNLFNLLLWKAPIYYYTVNNDSKEKTAILQGIEWSWPCWWVQICDYHQKTDCIKMYCHSAVQFQHQYASLSMCFAGNMSNMNIFVEDNIRRCYFYIFCSFGTVGSTILFLNQGLGCKGYVASAIVSRGQTRGHAISAVFILWMLYF